MGPHISTEAAKVQNYRILKIRNISVSSLQQLILKHSKKPLFSFFGTEKINILKINLVLGKIK